VKICFNGNQVASCTKKILETLSEEKLTTSNNVKKINDNSFEVTLSGKADMVEKLIDKLVKLSELNVRHVMLGDFSITIGEKLTCPEYNRTYGNFKMTGFTPMSWNGSIDRGGKPYYCPNRCIRFALKVANTSTEFDAEYGNWHVAYHGTTHYLALAILLNGLKVSSYDPCSVFLSPSIEYSAHPTYATIWKFKGKYHQMVLQVRVSPDVITSIEEGTIEGSTSKDEDCDPNFKNSELEWLIKPKIKKSFLQTLDGIVVYGLMVRITDEHPMNLPQNAWWKNSRGNEWDKDDDENFQ